MSTQRRAAIFTYVLLMLPATTLSAQAVPPAPSAVLAPDKPAVSQEELEQAIAPLALYPDSLLSQIFMASTYPLEIVEADRFVKANPQLQGDALAAALENQKWDPSIKSLVNFPAVLAMLSDKLDATARLGDAFIADQKRVMDAVQKLRAKAQAQGNLQSNAQEKVSVQQTPAAQVITIEPTNPQVIYVPTYDPVVVYGAWPYPAYPPYYYHPPGYVATAAISFGVGVACGLAWGYAWGHCDWGHNNIDININQNINFNNHIDRNVYQNQFNHNHPGGVQGNAWQHDPSHRDGVPYRDSASAQKFGGVSANQATQARDAYRGRAETGRQDISNGSANQFRGGGGAPNAPGPNGGVPNGNAVNRGTPGGSGGGIQNRGGDNSHPGAFGGAGSDGNAARAASRQGRASRGGAPRGGGRRR